MTHFVISLLLTNTTNSVIKSHNTDFILGWFIKLILWFVRTHFVIPAWSVINLLKFLEQLMLRLFIFNVTFIIVLASWSIKLLGFLHCYTYLSFASFLLTLYIITRQSYSTFFLFTSKDTSSLNAFNKSSTSPLIVSLPMFIISTPMHSY